MRFISILVLLVWTLAAQAQSLFPLDAGNQWTYRDRVTSETFTVRVGTPVEIEGKTYLSLTGYVDRPVLVRFATQDAMVYYDVDTKQELVLTSFEVTKGVGWFFARLRPPAECEQNFQAQPDKTEFKGPAGRFSEAVTLLYRTIGCADAGIQNEIYVSGVGMVQRTVNSIAGPRTFDLVSAKIGNLNLQSDRGASFSVGVAAQKNSPALSAHLDLSINGDPMTLHFTSSQEFDAVLRAADGTGVWQWSASRTFLQTLHDEVISSRSWDFEVPMTDANGAPLAAGAYVLEAWITSGSDRPQFVSSISVQVPDKVSIAQPARQ